MHQLLHISILVATILGSACLFLMLMWPLLSDSPLPTATRFGLLGLVSIGAVLFLLEWRVVH